MHLGKEDFVFLSVLSLPHAHAAFEGTLAPLPVLVRILALELFQQRLGLQPRRYLEQFLQSRPHGYQRINACPPDMWLPGFAGQLAPLAILPRCLGIHATLHRRFVQRCSLVQPAAQFLDLGVRDDSSLSHWQLLSL